MGYSLCVQTPVLLCVWNEVEELQMPTLGRAAAINPSKQHCQPGRKRCCDSSGGEGCAD